MRFRIIFYALAILLLGACSGNTVFEKHYDIPNHVWAKSDTIIFEVPITDVSADYDIVIAVRHMSAYPYADVIVGLTIAFPSGEFRMKEHDLIIRNTDGSFKGEGLGDIWDIEIPVFKKYRFPDAGTYRFIIENRMHLIEMPGIMAIGLVVKKSTTETE